MTKRKEGAISAELLDQLLDGQDPSTVLESGGLMGDLKLLGSDTNQEPRGKPRGIPHRV